jgi:myo-inositol-1(or 4)-monophosphatase
MRSCFSGPNGKGNAMLRSALPAKPKLLALRRTVAQIVLSVAHEVQRNHRRRDGAGVIRKAVGDFVTATDLRAERTLHSKLIKALPEAGFLGEETQSHGLEKDFVWVVDPIDGTSNYANGLPHYAVAVALLYQRMPVLSTIWCAPEFILYEAIRGVGAYRAGRRFTMPAGRWDDGSIVGCQWHRGQQDMKFLAKLQRDGTRIRTFGCTVVQLADVACGRLDANVQQQGRVWDVAAPGLLVEAAGGVFTDWRGVPIFPFKRLDVGHLPSIAASSTVHPRILARLRGSVAVPPA